METLPIGVGGIVVIVVGGVAAGTSTGSVVVVWRRVVPVGCRRAGVRDVTRGVAGRVVFVGLVRLLDFLGIFDSLVNHLGCCHGRSSKDSVLPGSIETQLGERTCGT